MTKPHIVSQCQLWTAMVLLAPAVKPVKIATSALSVVHKRTKIKIVLIIT